MGVGSELLVTAGVGTGADVDGVVAPGMGALDVAELQPLKISMPDTTATTNETRNATFRSVLRSSLASPLSIGVWRTPLQPKTAMLPALQQQR